MKFAPPEKTPKPRESLGSFLAFAFVILWIAGMFCGLNGLVCRSDRNEGRLKLGFCNVALASGIWTRLTPIGQARGSILNLERGIALSQLGRNEEAQASFKRALRYASSVGQLTWESKLYDRMGSLNDKNAVEIWEQVVTTAN